MNLQPIWVAGPLRYGWLPPSIFDLMITTAMRTYDGPGSHISVVRVTLLNISRSLSASRASLCPSAVICAIRCFCFSLLLMGTRTLLIFYQFYVVSSVARTVAAGDIYTWRLVDIAQKLKLKKKRLVLFRFIFEPRKRRRRSQQERCLWPE